MKTKASLLWLVLVVLWTGCKSPELATVADARYLSAKVKLTLPHKGNESTVNGSLRVIAGECIQLSFLVPMVRSEAVRIEMTPEYVLIIDRTERRYIRISPQTLHTKLSGGYNYNRMERLFMSAALKKRKRVTLTPRELGLPTTAKGRMVLSRFSNRTFTRRPSQLSQRYKQVSWREFTEMLPKR
ncbi:MAG: DUF4292 domain-containing protein [Prevotellaceae bacterium]|jgi:hypothetical protein|nr:DUF4292 domain-containing protein [Prevotellaceae bacterium]